MWYTWDMLSFSFRYPDKPIDTTPKVIEGLDPSKWICNAKYDGWRLETYADGPGHVRCLSRVGRPMEQTPAKFDKSFVQAFQDMRLPGGTVIDAEFVGPRGGLDPAVYIFDMLAWDGDWLCTEPYEKRWERCQQLQLTHPDIHLAETVQDDFLALFERLKASWDGKSIDLCEGIVVKSRKGKMKLNRNGSAKSDCMFRLKYRDIRDRRY